MSENTKLWDILGRTDPKHTKAFTRAGGFKGTAIKPMWSYRRMTEEFGPCGHGWGVGKPDFQVVHTAEEMLVYCTASVWWTSNANMARIGADGIAETMPLVIHTVYGVGGDKIVGKFLTGLKSDDEAFKKSFTDAITNALKLIGVGADVHMGMFDDNKYVNTMQQEFAEPKREEVRDDGVVTDDHGKASDYEVREAYDAPPRRKSGLPEYGWREDGSKTTYALKKSGSWEEVKANLDQDLVDCDTFSKLEKLKEIYRGFAAEKKWNKSFLLALKQEFDLHEKFLMEEMDRQNDAEELAKFPLKTALKNSIKPDKDDSRTSPANTILAGG